MGLLAEGTSEQTGSAPSHLADPSSLWTTRASAPVNRIPEAKSFVDTEKGAAYEPVLEDDAH